MVFLFTSSVRSGNEYKFCGTIVRMIFTRSVLFGEVVVTDKVVVAKRREVKFEDIAASPHAAKIYEAIKVINFRMTIGIHYHLEHNLIFQIKDL